MDQLPAGIPAPPEQAVTGDRDPVTGQLIPGPQTSELSRRAALAKHEQRKVEKLLSLATIDEEHPYAPYQRMVRQWRDDHMAELASTVGGGLVGPGPASIIASAAMQLGQSRWLADLALKEEDPKAILGLVERSQRLADSSRQNLLAAHELVAREAKARAAQAKAFPASQVSTLVEALRPQEPPKSTEGPALPPSTLDISDFPEIEDYDE